MRKITAQIVGAFNEGRSGRSGHSETDGKHLWLYGHMIARRLPIGQVEVATAGWNTSTTRNRLNAITGVQVNTKRGQLMLNGKNWNGEWEFV